MVLLLLLGAGCQKIDFDDENVVITSGSGISVYKTKKDYFDFVTVGIDSTDQIWMVPGYIKSDSRVLVEKDGDVIFTNRWRLKSGFVVAPEVAFNHSFTNISIKEFVDYTSKHNSGAWSDELIFSRIIDRDPFVSYYHIDTRNTEEITYTLGELNKMIEDGTIENTFTKYK